MKRLTAIATLGSVAFAGAVWCATEVWGPDNFTMEQRKWQAAPSVTPGKDNPAQAMDGSHHPSDDCGICHAPKSADPNVIYTPQASGRVFTLTATIYDSRAARKPLPGAEVVFQDYAGNTFSMTANDLGNMWTQAEMAGDTHLGGAADDSNNWRYKAWVRAGGGERPMMTMPGVGGMTVPRMSCNMHHVISGTLGGLWAVPAGTLKSYPAAGLSYRKHVFPILRTKCGPCHIPGPTQATQTDDTFDYGADLDLMNYAGSTVEVEDATTHAVTTYEKRGVQSIVNTSSPDASLLFSKTLAGGLHGGGAFWKVDDPDYKALRQWIAEGAKDN